MASQFLFRIHDKYFTGPEEEQTEEHLPFY